MIDAFNSHRSLLFGIAYRMLGHVADAEDMVQETFVRWRRQDATEIKSAKAWLIATITRLSIDQLRSARRQREEYVGVWLPEPLVDSSDTPSPVSTAELADSLSLAFLHLLEQLAPVERAVFILREVFDYNYVEIARIVEKSEANCRQMFSRAKNQLGQREARTETSDAKAEEIVQRFLSACATGDLKSFLAVLTDDVVLYTDGGAKMRAARRPIQGANRVSRFFIGLRERALVGYETQFVRVNGETGIVATRASGRVDVSAFTFSDNRIKGIYVVSNPDKLRRLLKAGLARLGRTEG
jgi:RNA polymerase sigma-70 factor (ECF subfamily)